MLSSIAKILLTSTAIAPVGLTYAWMALQDGQPQIAGLIFVICAFLVVVCVLTIMYAKLTLEFIPFSATSVEAADRENTTFLLLYLLPLFTDSFSNLKWSVWIPTLIIFALLTATGYNYHVNPLIGLLGWHFYKVQSRDGVTYILITRKTIRRSLENLRVAQLTEYMLIERGGK